MSEQIRISAKSLGELALPGFCPRCFWIKLKLKKLPFQIFPGIFSSIDSYTKKIVHSWFDGHKSFPSWLNELGDLVGYQTPPHYSKFYTVDSDSNVMLWGTPDEIFVRSDGSYIIADYKTARYTPAQDGLLPLYRVQLNAYAMIGENNGLNPVSDLALIYMEPVTDGQSLANGLNYRDDGFAMGFAAGIHKVALELAAIPPLLAKAREIYEMGAAPDGCGGCHDCQHLDELFNLLDK